VTYVGVDRVEGLAEAGPAVDARRCHQLDQVRCQGGIRSSRRGSGGSQTLPECLLRRAVCCDAPHTGVMRAM